MTQTPVVIIGASLSGLACAACLQRQSIPYVILEKENQIATPWRNHYKRLHLHTARSLSSLPYKAFSTKSAWYPSRQEVIDYIDDYRQSFGIEPLFNTEATSLKKENNSWITETNTGAFQSRYVIIATGAFYQPKTFDCPGIATFPGRILHSSQFKTGKEFVGKEVLVIGFGNSACEIAIDLYEEEARPSLSVRSPVNVVPRDLLRIPIVHYSFLLSKLPHRVADTIASIIMKLAYGNFADYGLQQANAGIFAQVRNNLLPVLDIGTMQHIRKGHISVFTGIDHIDNSTVHFKDGKQKTFDAIIAAVGYENRMPSFVKDFQNEPHERREKDGLYTCGFSITATGHIRQIARDAKRIAKAIAKNV